MVRKGVYSGSSLGDHFGSLGGHHDNSQRAIISFVRNWIFCSKINLFTVITIKMIRQLSFYIAILTVCSLVSCNLPVSQSGTATMSANSVFATVAANLTAEARPTSNERGTQASTSLTITPTHANQAATSKATALLTLTPRPSGTALPCDQASAGHPIDITIPDDTQLKPGQSFSKTWRLVNSGTCVWNNSYAVVWFSGEDIGVTREQFFITQVNPGQVIDVTVDMIAPEIAGSYQSNWKLRNQAGNLFGIGPNGGSPFWAKIIVNEESTPAPTSLPSETITPEALVSGVISMEVDNGLDLDTGEMSTGSNDDIKYVLVAENQPQIQPVNGAKLALTGAQQPSETICKTSDFSEAAINLAEMKEGSYLCYTTGQGLRGYLRVTVTSLAENILTLEYLTWANP
jgi:hypothetical protein